MISTVPIPRKPSKLDIRIEWGDLEPELTVSVVEELTSPPELCLFFTSCELPSKVNISSSELLGISRVEFSLSISSEDESSSSSSDREFPINTVNSSLAKSDASGIAFSSSTLLSQSSEFEDQTCGMIWDIFVGYSKLNSLWSFRNTEIQDLEVKKSWDDFCWQEEHESIYSPRLCLISCVWSSDFWLNKLLKRFFCISLKTNYTPFQTKL